MEGMGSSPETVEVTGTSPNNPTSSEASASQLRKPGKRDRVALACQRCKTRKQKVEQSSGFFILLFYLYLFFGGREIC